MRRGAVKSALEGFLGTYTSRYAEWRGYWLFGFIVAELCQVEFDLRAPQAFRKRPYVELAARYARERFAERLARNGVPAERLLAARLELERDPRLQRWNAAGRAIRVGHEVRFTACATMDSGATHQRDRFVLISPHAPRLESSSRCGPWLLDR